MLVCPQCHSENPNNSQVCQQCQTSLTHQSCPQCGHQTPVSEPHCSKCGTFMGKLWQVILAQPMSSDQTEKSLTFDNNYLDLGQRYQIWPSQETETFKVIATTSTHTLYQGQVLDCQPLEQSTLPTLVNQVSDLLKESEEEDPTLLWEQMGIPAHAFPYLTLKDLTPVVPEVYDAWTAWTVNETEVILLPDRTHWQTIPDLVIHQSLLTLQIIYWLNQMVTLWNSLSAINYCQSLLVEENLRLDEDQTFGLLKLYPDRPDAPPSLQQLGQLWQTWLTQGGYPCESKLASLIQRVAEGKLNQVAELRLELQDLAAEQQMTDDQENLTNTQVSPSSLDFVAEELPEFQEELLSDPLEETPTATDIANESTAVLPMELVNLTALGCTDRGRQRHHNEDYFGMNSELNIRQSNQGRIVNGRGLYLVCDGMGGHAAGEVASKMAIETLENFFAQHWQDDFPDQETILQGILLANKKLYDVNQSNASSGSGRMGTTLVLMLVDQTKVAVAHVGDSRVYCISRKKGLEQLTIDHEVGQRAIQQGIEPKLAYARPDAYQLTQALGPHDNKYIQPDIRFIDLAEDTLFLLCSDGLCDNDLVEDYWETYLLPLLKSTQSLDKTMRKLIEFANSYNGHDNITAVLVKLKIRPKVNPKDW
ncbi:probable protein phosphatase [Crocosphaera subtropica ATCC 51142]|uniref:Probable protein phosphatase n=1 Tax=Crocosphaera subtropica (strain ATCC 51142 / BH68) TaxID=43989 RepID=B1WZD5_CROS5|nr:serine/threonine phosphatase [Crocosphaera subtropica]ACB49501.1 probable protein phosphatase [Crocosphaera subtropica ATCC 51142]